MPKSERSHTAGSSPKGAMPIDLISISFLHPIRNRQTAPVRLLRSRSLARSAQDRIPQGFRESPWSMKNEQGAILDRLNTTIQKGGPLHQQLYVIYKKIPLKASPHQAFKGILSDRCRIGQHALENPIISGFSRPLRHSHSPSSLHF